jgi:hypothetical protein
MVRFALLLHFEKLGYTIEPRALTAETAQSNWARLLR